jgi:hypothetical protein
VIVSEIDHAPPIGILSVGVYMPETFITAAGIWCAWSASVVRWGSARVEASV